MNTILFQVSDDLIVRSWTVADAPALFALVDTNRKKLSTWLPWVPFVKEVKNSEKLITDSFESFEKNNGIELGIFYRNTLAGCIGLHEFDTTNHRTSLGYWLGSDFQGKGIMTQSVQALLTYCFTVKDFNRVEIRCGVENAKSRAIPERLGFTQEGILREAEFVEGKYIDDVVYSLLKKEWENYIKELP